MVKNTFFCVDKLKIAYLFMLFSASTPLWEIVKVFSLKYTERKSLTNALCPFNRPTNKSRFAIEIVNSGAFRSYKAKCFYQEFVRGEEQKKALPMLHFRLKACRLNANAAVCLQEASPCTYSVNDWQLVTTNSFMFNIHLASRLVCFYLCLLDADRHNYLYRQMNGWKHTGW